MKKVLLYTLLTIAVIFAFSSCGVGSYSVSSGREDVAGLSFTDNAKYDITVIVDGKDYQIQTVKAKAYKPGMKIKQTALNTIKIEPGKHTVIVKSGETEIFSKQLFLSTGESKVIGL